MDEQVIGENSATPDAELLSEAEGKQLFQATKPAMTLEEVHVLASNILRRAHRGALGTRRARDLMILVDSVATVAGQVDEKRRKEQELAIAGEMNDRLGRLENQQLGYGGQHAAGDGGGGGGDAQPAGADAGQPDAYPPEPSFSPAAPTIRYGDAGA